jgi:hypothetical protein
VVEAEEEAGEEEVEVASDLAEAEGDQARMREVLTREDPSYQTFSLNS